MFHHPSVLTSGFPLLFYKVQSLGINTVSIGEEISPDTCCCRQVGQCPSEGLNYQPSIVTAAAQRLECPGPVDVALAGCSAVILTDVYVFDKLDVGADTTYRVFLFDVGVKSIVMYADVGMVDAFDVVHRVGHRV